MAGPRHDFGTRRQRVQWTENPTPKESGSPTKLLLIRGLRSVVLCLALFQAPPRWYTHRGREFLTMPEVHPLSGRLRFGVFEVNLRAGELRKHGLQVRLQQQPFQILAMLLEHPGEVVTREELQKKLWPADTFVDFDHGLNKAISK